MPLSRPFAGNLMLGGILLMLLGDFMFALNDAMGKWLVASFSVGQVVLVRSIGAFFVLGPLIARQGAGRLFSIDRPVAQFLRVVATTVDTAFFYAAVIWLPLADVMSFYMAGPIYVAALPAARRGVGRSICNSQGRGFRFLEPGRSGCHPRCSSL